MKRINEWEQMSGGTVTNEVNNSIYCTVIKNPSV